VDFTFYVDAENYLPIRVFETWMKFIAQEASDNAQPERGNITSRSHEYFYRFEYIDEYKAEGLSITKFERSSYGGAKGTQGGILKYDFVKTYPISITSMPVSYDSSSLLKCTVGMTYVRYILNKTNDPPPQAPDQPARSTPIEQAAFNSAPSYLSNPQFGVDTTGGLSIQNSLSSGNSLQVYEGEEIIGAQTQLNTPLNIF